jgi:hypothetical protein
VTSQVLSLTPATRMSPMEKILRPILIQKAGCCAPLGLAADQFKSGAYVSLLLLNRALQLRNCLLLRLRQLLCGRQRTLQQVTTRRGHSQLRSAGVVLSPAPGHTTMLHKRRWYCLARGLHLQLLHRVLGLLEPRCQLRTPPPQSLDIALQAACLALQITTQAREGEMGQDHTVASRCHGSRVLALLPDSRRQQGRRAGLHKGCMLPAVTLLHT